MVEAHAAELNLHALQPATAGGCGAAVRGVVHMDGGEALRRERRARHCALLSHRVARRPLGAAQQQQQRPQGQHVYEAVRGWCSAPRCAHPARCNSSVRFERCVDLCLCRLCAGCCCCW
eukprot:COSAG01_NODE_990_length_12289_cov_22.606545_12_plen_119_part_00